MSETNYTADPKGTFTFIDFVDTEAGAAAVAAAIAGGYSGAGSPEGVVTAEPGVVYWDTAGQALWAKNTGTGNTGWVLVVTL